MRKTYSATVRINQNSKGIELNEETIKNTTMKIVSEYVAPWALPKENVPLHLMWEPTVSYDIIRIKLPPDLALKEFFNVANYTQENSMYLISQLKTSNFFGLTVASKRDFEAQHIKEIINITLIKDGKEIFSKDYNVNIFRPYLSLVESPTVITLTDDVQKKEPFWITLKLSGFGNVQIRTEISSGGEFIERAEPLYREIVRKLVSSFRLGELENKRKRIEINPLFIQNKVTEYIERIERKDFPLDVDEEDLEAFQDWVKIESNRDKIMELISRHLESLLVDSLVYYFDRYPTDSIQMPQGKPVMFIEKATQRIRIRFRYRDAMFNEYKPIEIAIDVEDNRKDKIVQLGIPINIKWIIERIDPLG